MSELATCPFCGATATTVTTTEVSGVALVFVRCTKCPAQMGNSQRAWEKRPSAIEWWNRRFANPPEVLPASPAPAAAGDA